MEQLPKVPVDLVSKIQVLDAVGNTYKLLGFTSNETPGEQPTLQTITIMDARTHVIRTISFDGKNYGGFSIKSFPDFS